MSAVAAPQRQRRAPVDRKRTATRTRNPELVVIEKKARFSGFRPWFIFAGVVFVGFIFVALGAYLRMVDDQNSLDALRQEIRSEQHENERLRQEESLAQSSGEVLRTAEDLGMVPPAQPAMVTPVAPVIGSPELESVEQVTPGDDAALRSQLASADVTEDESNDSDGIISE